MTFAPNMVADVARLRTARRLRGRPTGGVKAILQIGLPVLEGALERSVAVAASMDARGYGRTAQVPPAVRHTTNVLTLGGLLGMCAGTYGLLAAEGAAYGLPVLLIGLFLALAGLHLGGRLQHPDPLPARPLGVAGVAGRRVGCGRRGRPHPCRGRGPGRPPPRRRPPGRPHAPAVAAWRRS